MIRYANSGGAGLNYSTLIVEKYAPSVGNRDACLSFEVASKSENTDVVLDKEQALHLYEALGVFLGLKKPSPKKAGKIKGERI